MKQIKEKRESNRIKVLNVTSLNSLKENVSALSLRVTPYCH